MGILDKYLTGIALVFVCCLQTVTVPAQSQTWSDLPSKSFQPEGWVHEFLQRQEEGLGTHPEESGFPYNTKMWTEAMNYKDREYAGGEDWWPYEQTAYFLDGTLRCGYLNQSDKLLSRALENLNYLVEHADNNGVMHAGNLGFQREEWPMVVIMRMLIEQYKNTKDPQLLAAIEKHYKAIYSNEENLKMKKTTGFDIRPILHVELLSDLYGITNDKWYIDTAEKLYASFQQKAEEVKSQNNSLYSLSAKGMAEGETPSGHAVSYHEFLKLPAILYMYTGKEAYKTAIYTAYPALQKAHELADGAAANHEALSGKGSNEAEETCSLIDFNWTTGWALLATGDPLFADKMEKVLYNAAFSSITKDFKAYQYYQMPNLLISTNASSFYNDDQKWGAVAKGRLCYRPGHDTECCAGNIHRMLPTFINRSCLVSGSRVKLALYLPGTVNLKTERGDLNFTQLTNYPFQHEIKIVINEAPNSKIDFDLRIPDWAISYDIELNEKTLYKGKEHGIFKTITRNFKKNDTIVVRFNAIPVIDDRGQGVAINYGPLVFSYPIESRERRTTSDDGHKSSPEFPAYEYAPQNIHKWAIALPGNLKSEDIEVIKTETSGYPWDNGNAPITLRVKAKTVTNWKLNSWIAPAAYPENVKTDQDITVDLVPASTAILKITEFPKFEK